MIRRLAVVSAFVVLQAGFLFGVSGDASASPVLVGHVSCSTFTGAGKFSPGLTTAGSAGGVKITVKGKIFGCTGGSITIGSTTYTVTGGSATINDWYFTGTTGSKCANFQGAVPLDKVGLIKMKVKWTLSPPLVVAPSHVKYSAGTYSAVTPAFGPMALDLGSLATPPSTTSITGSYAADFLTQNTLMNIPTPPAGCPVGPAFAFPTGAMAF
jgi:hypothetical protein